MPWSLVAAGRSVSKKNKVFWRAGTTCEAALVLLEETRKGDEETGSPHRYNTHTHSLTHPTTTITTTIAGPGKEGSLEKSVSTKF